MLGLRDRIWFAKSRHSGQHDWGWLGHHSREQETVSEYEVVLHEFGYDFENPDGQDCFDWLRNMLNGCRAAKEVAKR